MASFVVMQSPRADEDAVLVRDGFAVVAFLIPAVWLLWHRLWIEAAAAILLAGALAGIGAYTGLGNAAPVLSLLVGLLVGLEGASFRIAALRRRGWRDWGVVEAETAQDAEIRYVAEAHDSRVEESPRPATPAPSHKPLRGDASAPVLGLFAYPGRG